MPEIATELTLPLYQRAESGFSYMRTRPLLVRPYNPFTGASQGGAMTAGSSTLEPWNATRVAKAEALFSLDGVGGLSLVFPWMLIEPLPPINGVHFYDWGPIDAGLAETGHYPGGKCSLRINSGGPSAPNWIMGGGTARLAVTPSIGGTSIQVAASGQIPPNGSAQFYLDSGPGQQEGPFVTSALAGATFTISGSVGNSHLAPGICEWAKVPAAWVNNQAGGWKSGDIVLAPIGSINVLGVQVGNLAYVATLDIPQTSYGTGTSTAANFQLFLAANQLCELIQFANGDQMAAPWDATYQANRLAFLRAFGARYAGDPRIDAIQMAGAGYLGEMTLHSADSAIQIIASWLTHGYNDWSYVDVWKLFIDTFAAAFPDPNFMLCLDIDEPFGGIGPGGAAWPTVVAPAAACGTLTTPVVNCTNTIYNSRVDTVSGVTNENASFTDASAVAGDVGRRVTGLTGITVDRFVGSVAGSTVTLSTSRFANITPPSHVISGTSATISDDIQTGMIVLGHADIPTWAWVGWVTHNTSFTLSKGQGMSGTLTSATSTTGVDTNANWTPGQWIGWKVYSGAAGVSTGTVTSNTATSFVVGSWTSATPTTALGMLYSFALDQAATGTSPGITLNFNSTIRTDTITNGGNENAIHTDASLTLADRGKLITGLGSISANRFVGPIGGTVLGSALGLTAGQFYMSKFPFPPADANDFTNNHKPASKVITGTSMTLAHDTKAYNSPTTNGGVVRRAVAGSNQGGTLTSDVYSGGSPAIAGLTANYPYRIALQQNGLVQGDLNSLQVSRYRQLIASSSPVAVDKSDVTLQHIGNGYQPHNGGNTAPNIKTMLEVAFDDLAPNGVIASLSGKALPLSKAKAYIEEYANDVLTNPSDNALFASGVRP